MNNKKEISTLVQWLPPGQGSVAPTDSRHFVAQDQGCTESCHENESMLPSQTPALLIGKIPQLIPRHPKQRPNRTLRTTIFSKRLPLSVLFMAILSSTNACFRVPKRPFRHVSSFVNHEQNILSNLGKPSIFLESMHSIRSPSIKCFQKPIQMIFIRAMQRHM